MNHELQFLKGRIIPLLKGRDPKVVLRGLGLLLWSEW